MADRDQVFRVSGELHGRVKGYCEARKIHPRKFVEDALDRAMRSGVMPVEKKPLPRPVTTGVTEEQLLNNPPFWKQKRERWSR